jgi:hypothetical protein
VPTDGFQQVEGASWRVEFPEHEQPRRVGACCHLGMAGCAGKLRGMAVGGELLDERPSEVCVGLDNENRLAAGAPSWCCLLAAYAGGADGDCLRAHAASGPCVSVRVAWRERARWFEGESPYRRLNARAK